MTLVHGGRRVEHAMFRGRRVPLFVAGRLVLPVNLVYEASEWEATGSNGIPLNPKAAPQLNGGGDVTLTRVVLDAGSYEVVGSAWKDRILRISVLNTSDNSVIAQQDFDDSFGHQAEVTLPFTLDEPTCFNLEGGGRENTPWNRRGLRSIGGGGGSKPDNRLRLELAA